MLTDDELAAMRATVNAALPDSGTIWRMPTQTKDGAGGYLAGTLMAAGTVACRVAPAGGPSEELLVTQMRLQGVQPYAITMPAGTDIRSTDQFTSGGVTYEVQGALSPRSEQVSTRVAAKVVD